MKTSTREGNDLMEADRTNTVNSSITRSIKEKIEDRVGIVLDRPQYRTRLNKQIKNRIRETGCDSPGDYLALLNSSGSEEELMELIDRIVVNETLFYRNGAQMETFEREVLPSLIEGTDQLRILSAGCSDGAEPYSIAIAVREVLNNRVDSSATLDGWEVFGVDISRSAIHTARRGRYSKRRVENAPDGVVSKYFEWDGDAYQLREDVIDHVQFKQRNLKSDPIPDQLDVVFIRNILIYFEDDVRRSILDRVLDRLSPEGYLIAGHSEDLSRFHDQIGSSKWGHQIFRFNPAADQTPAGTTTTDNEPRTSTKKFSPTSVESDDPHQLLEIQQAPEDVSGTVVKGRVRHVIDDRSRPVVLKWSASSEVTRDTLRDLIESINGVLDGARVQGLRSKSSDVEDTAKDIIDGSGRAQTKQRTRDRHPTGETNRSHPGGQPNQGGQPWTIGTEEEADTLIIHCCGDINPEQNPGLKGDLKDYLEPELEGGRGDHREIVFNLNDIDYLDRSFARLYRRFKRLFSDDRVTVKVRSDDSGVRSRLDRWGLSSAAVKGGDHRD